MSQNHLELKQLHQQRDIKKRKRNPEKWKTYVKKGNLNSGEAYERKNKKGEIVPKAKKILKPPCGETCRKKCSDAFSEEDRKQIFEEFWNLADIDLQRAFIIAYVSVPDKKRTRVRNTCKTARRKKELTRAYFLNNAATKTLIPVCQKFFLNTLAVDKKRVRTALAKKVVAGTVKTDSRGKHNHHANCEERQKNVMDHIQLFKVVESHYVRKESKYQYLPDTLNISEMHRMYTEWCDGQGINAENYAFYKRVFNEHFDLKFQKLQKDECDKCTSFNNTPEDARSEEVCVEQEEHIKEKELARKKKEDLKEESAQLKTHLTAAFDLEKVLLSPHGQTSSFYYSRCLKNHNFSY